MSLAILKSSKGFVFGDLTLCKDRVAVVGQGSRQTLSVSLSTIRAIHDNQLSLEEIAPRALVHFCISEKSIGEIMA